MTVSKHRLRSDMAAKRGGLCCAYKAELYINVMYNLFMCVHFECRSLLLVCGSVVPFLFVCKSVVVGRNSFWLCDSCE